MQTKYLFMKTTELLSRKNTQEIIRNCTSIVPTYYTKHSEQTKNASAFHRLSSNISKEGYQQGKHYRTKCVHPVDWKS